MLSVMFVLSVTLAYCGQTVGWIRMPLGTEVGVGPGDILLDADPATPPPKKGGWVAQQPLHVSAHVYWSIVAKRSSISATAELVLIVLKSSDLLYMYRPIE